MPLLGTAAISSQFCGVMSTQFCFTTIARGRHCYATRAAGMLGLGLGLALRPENGGLGLGLGLGSSGLGLGISGLGLGLDTKALALPISRPRPGSHSITMCLLDCH